MNKGKFCRFIPFWQTNIVQLNTAIKLVVNNFPLIMKSRQRVAHADFGRGYFLIADVEVDLADDNNKSYNKSYK